MFDAVKTLVIRSLFGAPTSVLPVFLGPPRMEEGHRQDIQHHWFCRLSEVLAPEQAPPREVIPEVRRVQAEVGGALGGRMQSGVRVHHREMALRGRTLDAWVYTPELQSGAALVFYHGGGFVLGSNRTHGAACARLASRVGCVVIAVDYRLAPEHPFPAAVEDAVDAYDWVVGRASDFGVEPSRVGVAGDSAGGNLAAVVVNTHVAQGLRPPAMQLLVYPVTDLSRESASVKRFATGHFLTRQRMRWFNDHYAPERGMREDERASPLLAQELSGASPAVVVTAGFDILRDEGRAYAWRLKDAGVEVEVLHQPELIHGFFNLAGIYPAAARAFDACSARTRAMLDRVR
ncbi:MAG: alpha/beta hydrolase [Myxococcota bacterium]